MKLGDSRAAVRPEQYQRLAHAPVLAVGSAAAAVLLIFAGRYGYFGDELYFISAGRHLDWGYVDQQPFIPLVAWTMDTLFPGSLVALRAPNALAFGIGAVVAALIARELGGDRRAQVLTSTAFVLAFVSLFRNLNTIGFDILLWTVASLLLIRWVRTYHNKAEDDRLLLGAGVVVAISFQVKSQIAVFALLVVCMLALCGPRQMLRRPLLWIGGVIAAVVSAPTIIWQASNGWPQLDMSGAVAAELGVSGGRFMTAFGMIALLGLVYGVVLGGYGFWRLLRASELRPYRFFGWTVVAVAATFLVANGKPYYAAGLYPVLFAAGAVGFQRRRESGTARWGWLVWPALAVSLFITAQSLPLVPSQARAQARTGRYDFTLNEFGWPELAAHVNRIYRALPPEQQQHTVVLSTHYWAASAIEFYGDHYGLPEAYSGSRGYWYFGKPPQTATTVIHIGRIRTDVREYFSDVRAVGVVTNKHGARNVLHGQPIYLARTDGVDWAHVWADFDRITVVE